MTDKGEATQDTGGPERFSTRITLLSDEELFERLKARYPDIIAQQTMELSALRAERDRFETLLKESQGNADPQAQRCRRCGRADGQWFQVSDEHWRVIAGTFGVLCLWCFDVLANGVGQNYTITALGFAGSRTAVEFSNESQDLLAAAQEENERLRDNRPWWENASYAHIRAERDDLRRELAEAIALPDTERDRLLTENKRLTSQVEWERSRVFRVKPSEDAATALGETWADFATDTDMLRLDAEARAERAEGALERHRVAVMEAQSYIADLADAIERETGKPHDADAIFALIEDTIAAALPPGAKPPSAEAALERVHVALNNLCSATTVLIGRLHTGGWLGGADSTGVMLSVRAALDDARAALSLPPGAKPRFTEAEQAEIDASPLTTVTSTVRLPPGAKQLGGTD